MDYTGGVVEYSVDTYGWMAVALVIFTVWRPNWAILGSIVFSILYLLPNYVNVGFAGREAIKMIPYLVTIVVLVITSIVSRRESQPPGVAGAQLFQGRAIADPRGQMPQNSLRGGGCGMRVAHRMCGVNAITVTVGGAPSARAFRCSARCAAFKR